MSLRFGILGLLAEEPLHGYEVKARFEAMLGHTWEVNIGQVYSTMQRLERDGLVRRRVTPTVPVTVEYSLLPLGATLAAAVDPLREWAEGNLKEVLAAQRRYDVQHKAAAA